MLGFDLAKIYDYETKNFNRQVKRNIEKFEGEDLMFQLIYEEVEILSRCQNGTLNKGEGRGSNIKYKPYVFSESALYIIMTVLKGKLATRQSRALIRAFRKMNDYIIENRGLLGERECLQLSMQTTSNVKDILELKNTFDLVEGNVAVVMDKLGDVVLKSELSDITMNFREPQIRRGFLMLNGQPARESLAYKEIYCLDEKSIYVVDNYIGLKTLVLLKDVATNVEVTIFSDNLGKKLHQIEYDDFVKEYPSIKINFKKAGGIFHDRYIIIDYKTENEKVYHCGASSKNAGERVTTITEVPEKEIYNGLIEKLLKNDELKLKQ